MSFCPTSNLFLGSGLFDLRAASDAGVRTGLGTDVGGGTSFQHAAHDARGVQGGAARRPDALAAARPLPEQPWAPRAPSVSKDRIGNFEAGRDGDFIVLDWAATPLMARRTARAAGLAEKLFVMIMLGDDRAVAATHLMAVARGRASVRPGDDAPAFLDRSGELVLDVPGEIDPLVLLEFLDQRIDDGRPSGLA